ncbi:MAG TPA: type II toxin-antitoxin system VapC family toxin [Rhizobiaceae bacterium]|nr:type II toxin-antitoxin system VapC family toxin [Rhizobiaceae bacterium]
MTIVDTNVLLDLVTDDERWFEWSLNAIETAAAEGPLLLNAVIYAELSARYEQLSEVDDFVAKANVQFADIPREAAFAAAKAFGEYRGGGGSKTGVLSDFFIGAHAAVLDVPILTRDMGRYRTYFPHVRLIAPQIN